MIYINTDYPADENGIKLPDSIIQIIKKYILPSKKDYKSLVVYADKLYWYTKKEMTAQTLVPAGTGVGRYITDMSGRTDVNILINLDELCNELIYTFLCKFIHDMEYSALSRLYLFSVEGLHFQAGKFTDIPIPANCDDVWQCRAGQVIKNSYIRGNQNNNDPPNFPSIYGISRVITSNENLSRPIFETYIRMNELCLDKITGSGNVPAVDTEKNENLRKAKIYIDELKDKFYSWYAV